MCVYKAKFYQRIYEERNTINTQHKKMYGGDIYWSNLEAKFQNSLFEKEYLLK